MDSWLLKIQLKKISFWGPVCASNQVLLVFPLPNLYFTFPYLIVLWDTRVQLFIMLQLSVIVINAGSYTINKYLINISKYLHCNKLKNCVNIYRCHIVYTIFLPTHKCSVSPRISNWPQSILTQLDAACSESLLIRLIHAKFSPWLTLASYPVWKVLVTHALIFRHFVLRQLSQPFLNLLVKSCLSLFSCL